MKKIVLKTAQRRTTLSRATVRNAVSGVFSKTTTPSASSKTASKSVTQSAATKMKSTAKRA